jgi:hypothetical protein
VSGEERAALEPITADHLRRAAGAIDALEDAGTVPAADLDVLREAWGLALVSWMQRHGAALRAVINRLDERRTGTAAGLELAVRSFPPVDPPRLRGVR